MRSVEVAINPQTQATLISLANHYAQLRYLKQHIFNATVVRFTIS